MSFVASHELVYLYVSLELLLEVFADGLLRIFESSAALDVPVADLDGINELAKLAILAVYSGVLGTDAELSDFGVLDGFVAPTTLSPNALTTLLFVVFVLVEPVVLVPVALLVAVVFVPVEPDVPVLEPDVLVPVELLLHAVPVCVGVELAKLLPEFCANSDAVLVGDLDALCLFQTNAIDSVPLSGILLFN